MAKIDNVSYSFMSQKQIADKANNNISNFITVADAVFKRIDWFSTSKFEYISQNIGTTPLEYPLKKAIKGNVDENIKFVVGKALKASVVDDIVTIEIYTQKFGELWELSHTHTIEKTLFDAYTLVMQNNETVSKAEKENKSPKNFSLNLG